MTVCSLSDARRIFAALALAFGSCAPPFPAAAFDNLPELGDPAGAVVTPQDERRIGLQTMQQLRSGGGYFDDPEVNAYLSALGQRLVAGVDGDHPEFSFFAVSSSEINAFALPGGFVGVNTGLILAARSESELASVLAHEISHVTQRHIARQLASNSKTQMLTMAALLGALVAGRSGNGQVASAALSTTMGIQAQSQINYTREHEREADRVGFSLLDKAGFDDRAMSSFFERLQQATRGYDGGAPSYLLTHPMTHERIADAQNREASRPYRQVVDSADFHFVRALLHSYDGTPEEAVRDFAARLGEKRYLDRTATRYGLAASLLRAKDFPKAMREIEALDRDGIQHPMLDAMAGQVLQQAGRHQAAVKRYETALERYPQHLQLVLDYPRALMLEKRHADAAAFIEGQLPTHPGNATLHEVAAEAYAALGNAMQSHRHRGEFYAIQGKAAAAVEQLELALRVDNGGTDIHEVMAIETRLKTLRESMQASPRGQG